MLFSSSRPPRQEKADQEEAAAGKAHEDCSPQNRHADVSFKVFAIPADKDRTPCRVDGGAAEASILKALLPPLASAPVTRGVRV